MTFVGTRTLESIKELKQLLTDLKQDSNYYFLRSPHQVSGIQSALPDNLNSATEGQVFNSQWELRWEKKGSNYQLLFLSNIEPNSDWGFKSLTLEQINSESKLIKWKTEDRKALLYEANEIRGREIRPKETHFPKGFIHNQPKICQRYFIDSQTSTVHFVALTVQ